MGRTCIMSRCQECGSDDITPQGLEYRGPSTLVEHIDCRTCGALFCQTFQVTKTELVEKGETR